MNNRLFVLVSLFSPLLLAAALPDLAAVDKLFAGAVKGSEHIDIVPLTQ